MTHIAVSMTEALDTGLPESEEIKDLRAPHGITLDGGREPRICTQNRKILVMSNAFRINRLHITVIPSEDNQKRESILSEHRFIKHAMGRSVDKMLPVSSQHIDQAMYL